jgi:prepilin-type N-terminal cleavage/methylation domain-containing protein
MSSMDTINLRAPLPLAAGCGENDSACRRGFTVIELLIVIAAVGIMAATITPMLGSSVPAGDLDASAQLATDALRRAQAAVMSGRQNNVGAASRWGVHFEGGQVVVFSGATYGPAGVDNQAVVFNQEVRVTSVSLGGSCSLPAGTGDCDVHFAKVNGEPTESGAVTLTSSAGGTKTVTVNAAGLTDFQ